MKDPLFKAAVGDKREPELLWDKVGVVQLLQEPKSVLSESPTEGA